MALLGSRKLKNFEVVTRATDSPEQDKAFYDVLDRDNFEKAGMRGNLRVDDTIHDRFFVLDNGTVYKLGRGLDIYKLAAGLRSRGHCVA
jgi:hypothetical protein